MNRHVPPHDLDSQEAATRSSSRPSPDFARAERHSARVRWVKRLLPIAVVAGVLVIGAGALVSRLKVKIDLPFDVGRLTLSGSRLTMELPKLSGFTDDNRGYNVSAKTASQDLTRPDVIDLTDISARLELADKGWASVSAKAGSFDTKKQSIDLDQGVDLAMNGGYGGHLQDAKVDVKAGTIVTDRPVVFTYLDGKLVADTLKVTDNGKRALFDGHVQLDFRLSQMTKKPASGGDSPAAAPTPSTASPRGELIPVDGGPATTASISPRPARGAGGPPETSAPLPSPRPVPHP